MAFLIYMNPTSQGNPFADIIAKFQAKAGAQTPQGAAPAPQEMPAGMPPKGMPPMMGGQPEEELPPDQMKYGETGDNTQNLIKAVTAVQGYIANSTNPQEIAVARSIVVLMSKLMAIDQQNAKKNLPTSQDGGMMEPEGPEMEAAEMNGPGE